MSDPILPSADAILSPAIDAIVALRPESLQHFNNGGNWSTLPALWRAQLLLNLARLGDEAQSARLRFSRGDALRALCASEFNTTLPKEPQTAYAHVSLVRQPPSTFPAGVIRTSDLFRKNADPSATPVPVAAATYAPISAVYVAQGQIGAEVPLRAVAAGADANIPYIANVGFPHSIALAQPLSWEKTWTTVFSFAGGGSSGLTDPVLVAASRAYAVGQFGPTLGALVAGVLRQQSVRHYAIFPASQALPYAQAYITDESWGQSDGWTNAVAQSVADTFQGFGCRTRFGNVGNIQIAVTATLVLASSDDLNNTDAIDVNVRAAAESYFNDRPDWYRFRLASLRSLLSKCDSRIQQCTSVTVTDAVTGAPIAEPANAFGLQWLGQIAHYYLVDRNVSTSYLPPT